LLRLQKQKAEFLEIRR